MFKLRSGIQPFSMFCEMKRKANDLLFNGIQCGKDSHSPWHSPILPNTTKATFDRQRWLSIGEGY